MEAMIEFENNNKLFSAVVSSVHGSLAAMGYLSIDTIGKYAAKTERRSEPEVHTLPDTYTYTDLWRTVFS